MQTPQIITERLVLREVRENDALPIYDCWMQGQDVSRYMWRKASNDFGETKKFVDYELQHVQDPKWKP